MIKEFREFIMRGNVMDLAVAVIIGAAFGAIITSLVNDVLMPPIGLAAGKVDFKDLFIALDGGGYASLADAKAKGAPVIAYGQFLNTIINFIIVAFAIFLLLKQVNRFKRPDVADTSTKACKFCTMTIATAATRCPHCTSQLAGA